MTSLTDERDALRKKLNEVDKKISLEKESAAKIEEQRLLDSLDEFENHDAMNVTPQEALALYRPRGI